MTNTNRYTDLVFGLFWLLSFQFSPRLADIKDRRFWRMERQADYGAFNDVSKHKISTKRVASDWDDMLRTAGSLKMGFCCKKSESGYSLMLLTKFYLRRSDAYEQPIQMATLPTRNYSAVCTLYLCYALSYRDLAEMKAERGLSLDHTTIFRWVQRYAPEIDRRCRSHFKPTNDSWRVDGTYVKVGGQWMYLYRAVDSTGQTLDFLLNETRSARAAKRFFRKVLGRPPRVAPRVINVDQNPAYIGAVRDFFLKTVNEGRPSI